jgi:DNA-binding MarR family transcriptional regulator
VTDLGALVDSLNELYRLSGSAKVHADTVRRTGVQVSQTGLRALSLVADAPGTTGTDLASILDVSQPTASRTLQGLEAEGYVTRHASDTDGRVSHYVTTAKGRKALAKVHQYHVDRLREALQGADTEAITSAVTDLVRRFTAAASPQKRRTA